MVDRSHRQVRFAVVCLAGWLAFQAGAEGATVRPQQADANRCAMSSAAAPGSSPCCLLRGSERSVMVGLTKHGDPSIAIDLVATGLPRGWVGQRGVSTPGPAAHRPASLQSLQARMQV